MTKKVSIFALALLLAACSPRIREGEVTEKEFHPAHTQMIIMPLTTCSSTGKAMTCHTTMIPMFFFYPDSWHVAIKKYDADAKEWRTATWWVPRDAFEQTVVGGYFKVNDRCNRDQPRQRVEREA